MFIGKQVDESKLIMPICKWPLTTRKLINTNGNIDGIFSSVNFRGILPTEIFPRYIPTELPWEKNLKQSKKKKDDVSFLPTEYSVGKIPP
jgi:hypothetical protein